DRTEVELDVEAVFTGDAVAFADLWDLGCEFGDSCKLAGGGFDADDRGEPVAEGAGVDLGAVAGDDAATLETLDALGDRGRGEVDAAAKLRERDPAVLRQPSDDLS